MKGGGSIETYEAYRAQNGQQFQSLCFLCLYVFKTAPQALKATAMIKRVIETHKSHSRMINVYVP